MAREYATFVMSETTLKQIESLPENMHLPFFWAVNRYGIYGEEPSFTGIELAVWLPMKAMIDNAKSKRKPGNPNFEEGRGNPYYQQKDNPLPEQNTVKDNSKIIKDNYFNNEIIKNNYQDNSDNSKDNSDNPKDNSDNSGQMVNVNVNANVNGNTNVHTQDACVCEENQKISEEPEIMPSFGNQGYMQAILSAWKEIPDNPDPGNLLRFLNYHARFIANSVRGIHSDDVLAAIANYGKVRALGHDTWWKRKTGIIPWFERHLDRFLPANFCLDDYREGGQKSEFDKGWDRLMEEMRNEQQSG